MYAVWQIKVVGNALRIVSFFNPSIRLFIPFRGGYLSGNCPCTRDFCEFCTTLPVPGTSLSSIRHPYPYPNFFTFVLSVGYTQNNTRSICPRYCLLNNLCNFRRTRIPVPGTSGSFVRRCQNDLGYGHSMFLPARNFWKFCTPVPQRAGVQAQHVYQPGTSVSSVCLCHNTRNNWKFCKTPIPLPGIHKPYKT